QPSAAAYAIRPVRAIVGTSAVPPGAWNGRGLVIAFGNDATQATFSHSALTTIAAVSRLSTPSASRSLISPRVVRSTSALIVSRDPSRSPAKSTVRADPPGQDFTASR